MFDRPYNPVELLLIQSPINNAPAIGAKEIPIQYNHVSHLWNYQVVGMTLILFEVPQQNHPISRDDHLIAGGAVDVDWVLIWWHRYTITTAGSLNASANLKQYSALSS